jgi:KDO2-lipid IV(A) lauroyltransferase
VQAMRANQWVVSGESLGEDALDRLVGKTFRYSAHCIFDLYHYIDNPDATRELIVFEPSFQWIMKRPEFDGRGLLVLGLHLSNFDLVLQWLCKYGGMKPLVLTIPNPQGGRRMEYEIRKRSGMNLIPASVSALRQAVNHLKRGGLVLTGIDRPIPEAKPRPRFFGRPASLPVHHIFLATKAHVPAVIAVANLQSDGKYCVFASDLIEMDSYPDSDAELLHNAEKVLKVAENFIRAVPQQWSVPLPVWPETVPFVPK